MSVDLKSRVFYINTDKIGGSSEDVTYCKNVIKELQAKGYSAHYMGRGPDVKSYPEKYGTMNEKAVNVHIVGGMCAGTIRDLTSAHFKKKMNGGTVIFAYRMDNHSVVPASLKRRGKDFENLTYLERSHDDDFSPSSFKGLKNPAKKLRNNNAGYVYGLNDSGELGSDRGAKYMADNLINNITGAPTNSVSGASSYSIRKDWGSSSGGTSDSKTETWGFNCDTPFQGYFKIVFSIDKPGNKRRYALIDFTANAPDKGYSFSNESPVLLNNEFREMRFNLLERLRTIRRDTQHKEKYYLHEIWLLDFIPKPENSTTTDGVENTDLYESTNHSDYRLLIRECGFSNYEEVNSTSLGLSGKSLLTALSECLEKTDYLYKIRYGKYRYLDHIDFYKDSQYDKPDHTYKQGSDGTILDVSSITYSPLTTVNNNSIVLFKRQPDSNDEDTITYSYAQSKANDNIFRYGEFTTLQSASDTISSAEAYYLALTNKDYIVDMDTTYTIAVAGFDGVELMDWVKTTLSKNYLNDVKRVNSIEVTGNVENRPMIRESLGLGAIDKKMRVQHRLANDRRKSKADVAEVVGGVTYVDTGAEYFMRDD